jgi:hypothetical protein
VYARGRWDRWGSYDMDSSFIGSGVAEIGGRSCPQAGKFNMITDKQTGVCYWASKTPAEVVARKWVVSSYL